MTGSSISPCGEGECAHTSPSTMFGRGPRRPAWHAGVLERGRHASASGGVVHPRVSRSAPRACRSAGIGYPSGAPPGANSASTSGRDLVVPQQPATRPPGGKTTILRSTPVAPVFCASTLPCGWSAARREEGPARRVAVRTGRPPSPSRMTASTRQAAGSAEHRRSGQTPFGASRPARPSPVCRRHIRRGEVVDHLPFGTRLPRRGATTASVGLPERGWAAASGTARRGSRRARTSSRRADT